MANPPRKSSSISETPMIGVVAVGGQQPSAARLGEYLCEHSMGFIADPEMDEPQKWKATDVAKDIALLSTGTLVAAIVNTGLLFLIPRILSVEEYGYWRLFVLYAGYVGLLHLGFPDGALVRWAGRDFFSFHHELRPSIRFLFLQQLALTIPLCVAFIRGLSHELRFIAVGIALLAVVMNLIALLQYAFQAARKFRPVAISTVLGPGLFLSFVLFWNRGLRQFLDSDRVIVLYSLAWLATLGFLFVKGGTWRGTDGGPARFAKSCISIGWPIVLANTVAALTLNVDRLALSWAANIRNFAQYSLAASAMAVPIMAIQASSKVLFPHLAGLPSENRMRFYGVASRSLVMAWALLLPYYFALEVFVRHVLPKYVPSLEIAKVLLLGIVFVAGIQVLQAAFAYLHGKQVRYLFGAAAMLALGCGAAYLAVFKFRSLELLAAVQVVVLAIWWLFNEWSLREITLQRARDWARFMSLFGAILLAYFLSAWLHRGPVMSALVYYAFIGTLFSVFCRTDLGIWCRILRVKWPAIGCVPDEKG